MKLAKYELAEQDAQDRWRACELDRSQLRVTPSRRLEVHKSYIHRI